MAEGYVRVAPDSTGKYIRNIELLVKQPDGTYLTVEQQVVTRAADDGTILDTLGLVENVHDQLMRKLAEDTLIKLQEVSDLLLNALDTPTTATQGEA